MLAQTAVLDFEDDIGGSDESAVVGHDDEGALVLLLQTAEDSIDFVAGFGVEFARRFVGEDENGVFDQCPRDRHALLFAAGELSRPVLEPIAETDLCKKVGRIFSEFRRQAARDVRDQGVVDRRKIADEIK